MDAKFLFFILFAYILGSINFAEIFTFHKLGTDIHSLGDGNPGATNVFLHVDRKLGFAVGILDALKGFLPLLLAYSKGICDTLLALIALSSVIGHQYPLFHKFKGGTGIATTIGVMIFFAPETTLYIFILSSIVVLAANYYKEQIQGTFSSLEVGESIGFVLLLFYTLFSSNGTVKAFVLLDISLIILRRYSRVKDFLHKHIFHREPEKHIH